MGHIFYLGTKYSKPFEALVDTNHGSKLIEMGCYGIGVTRIVAATVETSRDDKGIIWPQAIAPYQVIIIPLSQGKAEGTTTQVAEEIYDELEKSGFADEVIIEDRDESPGFKMNDAAFLGFPYIIVIGKSYREKKLLEVQVRSTGEKLYLPLDKVVQLLKQK